MSTAANSFMDTVIRNPTVLASSPPKRNVEPTLPGIDAQCREMILEMLLQNKVRCWNDTIIDSEVAPIELQIPYVGENDEVTYKYVISKGRIIIGNVNILRVCRQLYCEGSAILYGHNAFVSYNFPQLKHRFHGIIGRKNMKLIRKLTIGLPMKHKREEPVKCLGGFLEFLKEKLPSLCELTVTTQWERFERPFFDKLTNTRMGEEYRAMLNTSAWITCRHPLLKKAVWLVESGVVWSPPPYGMAGMAGTSSDNDSEEEGGHGENANSFVEADGTASGFTDGDIGGLGDAENDFKLFEEIDIDNLETCRLTVKILAEDRRFVIRTQPRIDLIPEIKKVIAHDIILDSRAIRRTEWVDLHGVHPGKFALPADAVSSEPPTPQASRDRNGRTYANWEVTSDFLRDRFKYLSMKDLTRLEG